MTPSDHAAAILALFAGRPLAAIEATWDDALLPHVDAIADAADSDDDAERAAGLGALFGGLIEPLNDGFTPAGRAVYARCFAHLAWRIGARVPALRAALADFDITDETALFTRYSAARASGSPLPVEPKRIVVLSRVTIGADILLTSVALQRLHQKWPTAELILLGDGKLAGLFGGLPQVRVRALSYARRGPLRERLASWLTVVDAVRAEAAELVFAPDSRLDQLGVLPVIHDPSRYLLWENTQPEGESPQSLAALLDHWLAERLGLPVAPEIVPRLALDAPTTVMQRTLVAAFGRMPIAAVKLDHGGNAAKALPRAGEVAVLRALRDNGWRVLLDRGFGADELANSDALLSELKWTAVDVDDSGKNLGRAVATLAAGELADAPVIRFHGSIAGWAAAASACGIALSYDSVGHHLAAALGVPVVVAFTGFADPAFPIAWQPRGRAQVTLVTIPTAEKTVPAQWQRVIAAVPFLSV